VWPGPDAQVARKVEFIKDSQIVTPNIEHEVARLIVRQASASSILRMIIRLPTRTVASAASQKEVRRIVNSLRSILSGFVMLDFEGLMLDQTV
jgi:hypothetical protein